MEDQKHIIKLAHLEKRLSGGGVVGNLTSVVTSPPSAKENILLNTNIGFGSSPSSPLSSQQQAQHQHLHLSASTSNISSTGSMATPATVIVEDSSSNTSNVIATAFVKSTYHEDGTPRSSPLAFQPVNGTDIGGGATATEVVDLVDDSPRSNEKKRDHLSVQADTGSIFHVDMEGEYDDSRQDNGSGEKAQKIFKSSNSRLSTNDDSEGHVQHSGGKPKHNQMHYLATTNLLGYPTKHFLFRVLATIAFVYRLSYVFVWCLHFRSDAGSRGAIISGKQPTINSYFQPTQPSTHPSHHPRHLLSPRRRHHHFHPQLPQQLIKRSHRPLKRLKGQSAETKAG
jgi:hypothetical protein